MTKIILFLFCLKYFCGERLKIFVIKQITILDQVLVNFLQKNNISLYCGWILSKRLMAYFWIFCCIFYIIFLLFSWPNSWSNQRIAKTTETGRYGMNTQRHREFMCLTLLRRFDFDATNPNKACLSDPFLRNSDKIIIESSPPFFF